MNIDTESIGEEFSSNVSSLTRNGWEGALKIILFAIVLLAVCLIVKTVLLKLLDRGLTRTNRVEKTLHAFIRSSANVLLWFITVMVVTQSLGINATSLITLLGIVGLAVSLSIQGSLANLAGGITILITKPFKVGDYVEMGSINGTVLEIGMVHTKLDTLDNRLVVVPNNIVVSNEVINYSAEPQRRVDLTVTAGYNAPVELVKETIHRVIELHEKTLSRPEPLVRLSNYGDSTIEYVVRVWCKNSDYWNVYYDVLEGIKVAFDEKGIVMSYPHLNVHMVADSKS